MKRLVWSFYYRGPNEPDYLGDHTAELLRLWLAHLRGPGRFDGDVALLTNAQDLAVPGVTRVPFDQTLSNKQEVYLARVRQVRLLPLRGYDSVLHLDLDALAVADASPLFADDRSLWVCSSEQSVLHPRHAGFFLSAAQRRLHHDLLLGRWRRGVNCSTFSFAPAHMEGTMDAWSRTIDRLLQSHPMAPLGDQSYVNYALWRSEFPIRRLPETWVQHHDWHDTPAVKVWHFACGDRLATMRRHSRVPLPPTAGVEAAA